MLKNENLVAKIGVDTAENEPCVKSDVSCAGDFVGWTAQPHGGECRAVRARFPEREPPRNPWNHPKHIYYGNTTLLRRSLETLRKNAL